MTDDAFWLAEVVDFVFVLGPLAGTMLLMPTLEESYGYIDSSRNMAKLPRIPINSYDLTRHFVFSAGAIDQGRWWTCASYMLVHANQEHLHNNLAALVPSGYHVYRHFGTLALYAGALDRTGKTRQHTAIIERSLQSIPAAIHGGIERSLDSAVGSSWREGVVGQAAEAVTEVLGKGAAGVAAVAAPTVTKWSTYVGASAGVCALDGVCLCLSVEAIVRLSRSLGLLGGSRSSRGSSSDQGANQDAASAVRLLAMLIGVGGSVGRVLEECAAMRQGVPDQADHAGHVAGFVAGVGCYAGSRSE